MAQSEVENAVTNSTQPVPATNALKSHPRKSILSRIWNGIFRSSNEDFEKRLQHLSKEEVYVHARSKRRSETWRKLARALIIYPVICEVFAIVIAIMSTKTPDLTWQMQALRVLPVFALPGFSALLYSTCSGYFRMFQSLFHNAVHEIMEATEEYSIEVCARLSFEKGSIGCLSSTDDS